jgi:hypothetical protein
LVLANEEPNREPKSSVSVFLVWFLVFSVRFSVLGIFLPRVTNRSRDCSNAGRRVARSAFAATGHAISPSFIFVYIVFKRIGTLYYFYKN